MEGVNGATPPALPRPGRLELATALLAMCALTAAQSESFLSNLLQQERFSNADLRALAAGQAVVRSLDTPVRQEIAHFGAVYIDVVVERFVDRFRDIERFESGPGIPQIRRFSNPPRLEDLASLTLPAKDVAALARCRPGDCGVKLPAAAMSRFRTRVDWSAPNPALQANVVAREMILELVNAYRAQGNAALGQYDDNGEPLPVAREFHALLNSGHQLPLPMPELMTFLEQYPRNRPAGAEDFFYWAVVDFGFKPTVRVNHVIIYPLAGRPSGVSHVLAIKQLYATHYFHTTLELRFLVAEERQRDRPGFHLLSITRSRSDGTTGLTGALIRPVINRRSRNAVRIYLEHLKRQVESTVPAGL